MKNKYVSIHLGAFAPRISQQVKGMDPKVGLHFDRDAEAIVRLKVRGLLSDGEGNRAGQRLVDKIAKHLAIREIDRKTKALAERKEKAKRSRRTREARPGKKTKNRKDRCVKGTSYTEAELGEMGLK